MTGFGVRLTQAMFPEYRGQLTRGRASFRPAEIAGRASSWRKDDTRLHVDSFPASPVQGRRILRVFTNVNPGQRPRSWRIGDSFEALATRFSPRRSAVSTRSPSASSDLLLQSSGISPQRQSMRHSATTS